MSTSGAASGGDSTVTAATAATVVESSKVVGDAANRYQRRADGLDAWGDGTSAVDTNLYRGGASQLKTDGTFLAGSSVAASGDSYARLADVGQTIMGAVGPGTASGITFGIAADTNIYRSSAGVLRTTSSLQVDGQFAAKLGLASQVGVGAYGPAAEAAVAFGAALDCNIYRTAAGALKTDGSWAVGTTGNITGDLTLGARLLMGGNYVQMTEMAAPGAGGANSGRLFLKDDGAGKTQLCIIFNTGAVQVIATQP